MEERKEGAMRCLHLIREDPTDHNMIKELYYELFINNITLRDIGSNKKEIKKLKEKGEK